MFIVLFNVVDNGACDLDFGEQVKVPQNGTHFSRLLELVPGIILEYKKVVLLLNILRDTCYSLRILYVEVGLPLSVSVREDVKADLKNHQGEIYVSDLVI